MPRWPKGIEFKLDSYLSKHATLVDDRMSISGDSYTWDKVNTNLKRVKYIVIHHSVTPRNWKPEKIALMHISRWGKNAGIGYHFVIRNNGDIERGRSIKKRGAHARGRNNYVGIVLTGYDTFTNAQLKLLVKLLKQLKITHIEPHHEKCPGIGLDLEEIKVKIRLDQHRYP